MTAGSRPNHPETVYAILRQLAEGGVDCLLFGGWAEEAFQMRAPGPHRDVDLLLPAPSFRVLDDLSHAGGSVLRSVPPKRFEHKRGLLYGGVLVEITLVQRSERTAFTLFWGDVRFDWNLPLSERACLNGRPVQAASRANLHLHRTNFQMTQPWRWRDPGVCCRRSNKPRQVQRA